MSARSELFIIFGSTNPALRAESGGGGGGRWRKVWSQMEERHDKVRGGASVRARVCVSGSTLAVPLRGAGGSGSVHVHVCVCCCWIITPPPPPPPPRPPAGLNRVVPLQMFTLCCNPLP